ncbi:MAG TPA: SRPBCC domain-containing protein [Solirubrobacteraceae bacterium]|jgi:uncharacterized protein YndB with AHSA1/START domain|nr:SRPBCC domain-containing protein [Solirubrobacteraceae bacterium]
MTGDSAREPRSAPAVRIARVFTAPREVVFNAWIDPDQVAAWWAPEGCEVPRETVDIDARAGGRIHFSIVDRARVSSVPVRFEIVEIAVPELLVFASEAMPEVGLLAMVTRVVFEDAGEGTRVTVTQGPHTDEMQTEAQAGWLGALEKLERLLGS